MNPKGLFKRATPESPQFTYDVFISYARADGKWIPKVLLPRLEKAGLTCAIDIRDFQPGVPTLTEIERCIQESRKTLMVLTLKYLEREWTTLEARMVQTLSPANRDRRLIPLLKKACEPSPGNRIVDIRELRVSRQPGVAVDPAYHGHRREGRI